jgi:ATP-dependent RNA helicase DDX5/DBP2
MMLGRDLVAQSPTGTGKTMAYLLPTIAHIIRQPKLPYGHGPLAVILVPSRELADQIQELAKMMTENMPKKSKKLNILSMIGGKSKKFQFTEIGKGVDLLIASPGRLYDMLISSASHLKHTSLIVLDEADKLVIGMEKEMKIILSQIHPNCQKVIFSATANIPGLHSVVKSMNDPIHLTVGESSVLLASKSVKQSFDFITENEKLEKLTEKYKDFVPKTDGKYERAIIFCGNRQSVEETASHLLHEGLNPIAFHLGLSQNERKWVLDEFQSNKSSLLVASHLIARGIGK